MSISQIQIKRLPIGRFGKHAGPRSHSTAHPARIGVPWWAVVAAGAAPALLVVGFLVAATLQPVSYDPLRDTISELAARGAADPWVMTAAIAAVGACYLVTALGLSPARRMRAPCARRRRRRDPVDCGLSDAAPRLLPAARFCGDRGLHDHVCVAGTGRGSTTSSTRC